MLCELWGMYGVPRCVALALLKQQQSSKIIAAYVDVCDAYVSRAKQDVVATRARRGHLVRLREHGQEKELVEVKTNSAKHARTHITMN